MFDIEELHQSKKDLIFIEIKLFLMTTTAIKFHCLNNTNIY